MVLHIRPAGGRVALSQITEAGILGKIGLNAAGVAVGLNAIRVRGVDFGRLPGHLALRAALDSPSRAAALDTLRRAGVAAAIHIVVADATGATSVEASARDLVETAEDAPGTARLAHANHFLHGHAEGVPVMVVPEESTKRAARAASLLAAAAAAPLTLTAAQTVAALEHILEDEDNGPLGINKAGTAAEPLRTLFSIVMDAGRGTATARVGRPAATSARISLRPGGVV